MNRIIIGLSALALCAACKPAEAPVATASATPIPYSDSGCPDDGPRLPLTNVCQGRAVAYLGDNAGAREPTLPDGCTWTVNETLLSADEALLYRAASCKGVTTQLAFAAGAHAGSLTYAASAAAGDAWKGNEVIQLYGVDPDPQGALKGFIAALPKAEQAKCEIQTAGYDGWPKDALVIGPTKAARAKAPKDEPLAMCGDHGIDEDSQTYWRIKQGYAWFFTLGQDETDFDPASMTIITKGADGAWGAKP